MRTEMRLKCALICAAILYLIAASQAVLAASTKNTCDLPSGLREELSTKYPEMRPVTLADLEEYDRKLFEKEHGAHCPGLLRVDFYGDGKSAWAGTVRRDSGRRTNVFTECRAGQ